MITHLNRCVEKQKQNLQNNDTLFYEIDFEEFEPCFVTFVGSPMALSRAFLFYLYSTLPHYFLLARQL